MASERLPDPNLDLVLSPLSGEPRTLREWLTTFHLASVVLDPYTNESSWILETAVRVMRQFSGAAVRVNFVVTCDADDARTFLGPFADEFLVFCDPERTAVKALGLSELPAFALVQSNGTIPAAAQGWNPAEWKLVATEVARITSWSKPTLPAPGDPVPFRGTPALA
ncbi:MAG: hypothetical protein ACO3RB_02390 [Ilumatobacteraceae bacterium]